MTSINYRVGGSVYVIYPHHSNHKLTVLLTKLKRLHGSQIFVSARQPSFSPVSTSAFNILSLADIKGC